MHCWLGKTGMHTYAAVRQVGRTPGGRQWTARRPSTWQRSLRHALLLLLLLLAAGEVDGFYDDIPRKNYTLTPRRMPAGLTLASAKRWYKKLENRVGVVTQVVQDR